MMPLKRISVRKFKLERAFVPWDCTETTMTMKVTTVDILKLIYWNTMILLLFEKFVLNLIHLVQGVLLSSVIILLQLI